MNDYKVHYRADGCETDGYDIVTASTEASAQRYFKARHKGEGYELLGVEIAREGVTATKQQERDALEAIRKMVAELGPQSYLATAFDGCFEDAENNIENDFGDSMWARWQSAVKDVKRLEARVKELEDKLLQEIAEKQQVRDTAQEAINDMGRRTLSADDLTDCKQIVKNLVDDLHRKVKAAEATILEYAEHPETTTFCDAVRERKNLHGDIAHYNALLTRLNNATEKGEQA